MSCKSGAGGEESALFASDLARMYLKYCERHGWKAQVLGVTESDLGGYKEATLSIKGREPSRDGVWSRLKFEGGVHRVQRVPVTESQGRIHTSAAGVLIYPEPEEVEEVEIDESDLRIDVYRSSGKGGQGVNTTDSAVRITHLPTGIVVTCQNERSQLQNKARAMQVLAARLQSAAEEEAEATAAEGRAAQIRTVDRSERIRTYNFPENRITDHRIGYKANDLDAVLSGDMDALLDALQMEVSGCGQLIGADHAVRAVTARLFDPGVSEVSVRGDARLAAQIVLRVVATGGTVAVHTSRPERWQHLVARVGDSRLLSFADPTGGSDADRRIHLFDGVSPRVVTPGATRIVVADLRQTTNDLPAATIELTQNLTQPDRVVLRTPVTSVCVTTVATPEEARFSAPPVQRTRVFPDTTGVPQPV